MKTYWLSLLFITAVCVISYKITIKALHKQTRHNYISDLRHNAIEKTKLAVTEDRKFGVTYDNSFDFSTDD